MTERTAQNMGVYDNHGVRVEHFPAIGRVEVWEEGPVATWTQVWATTGLLADPAQTTELEPDRLREELLQGVIDQDGERIKQLENEVARLRKAVQRPPHAAQVEAEERALTSARRADDTSLLLRGMARKLVAARRRIDAAFAELDEDGEDWHGAVDAERVRAALVGDQPLRKPCEYVVSAWAGQEGSECIATAEEGSDYCKPHGDALKALSGVALRDAEEADDAAGDLP